MMSVFENFIRCFLEEPERERKPSMSVTPVDTNKTCRYGDDIKALEEEYGDLKGKQLTIELQKLLTICPRHRHRIEAYQGLKSVLQKDYQCYLTILSQKTKN